MKPLHRMRAALARHDAVTLAALAFLALVVVVSVAAPLIAPHPPNQIDYAATFQGPSRAHLLGTDALGRDVLSRIIYGGRVSLVGVVEATAVFALIGIPAGLVAGYFGGWIDGVVNWSSEISFALPQIVVVLAVLAVFSNGTHAAMIMLGLLGAPGLAVMVRGATQAVMREQYIAAARVSGLRSWQIGLRHVLPRITGTVVVQLSLFAGTALLFQTGLEFLGLGTQPPTPSWGGMVSEGTQFIARDAWLIVPGGLTITLAVLAFSLVGDGVRDVHAGRRTRRVVPLGVAATAAEPGVAVDVHGADAHAPAPAPARAAEAAGSAPLPPAPAPGHGGEAAGSAPLPPPPVARSRRSPNTDALLWVEGLSVALRDASGAPSIPLLDDVSFEVEAGRAVGIVGESGSGKTLTSSAITGLLPPALAVTGGSWAFEGRPMHGMGERELSALRGSGIATISQEPITTLDPSFTVGAQLVEVVRRHRGTSRAQAKAEALRLLDEVKLPDPDRVARRYPHELSGGMAQRVSIAAALAGQPRLLIADEPTTALDPTVQAEILDVLRGLQRQAGLAIVLVSHDWGVIADMCDTAVVMYSGQVVESADVATIFEAPRHPYTRGLIEANPHYAQQPRTALPMIEGTVPAPGQWPAHCHFAARCRFSEADCLAQPIPEERVGDGHWSRCIHHERLKDLATPQGSTIHA